MAATGVQISGGRVVKQATISQGRKILVTELPPLGAAELHEEYDVITDELLLRKIRHKTTVGAFGAWEVEVGHAATAFVPEKDLLKESSGSPVVLRKDTADCVQFRIRNLNYAPDVFAVGVDAADQMSLVVRTTNKKYFKRLQIPELVRAKLPLEQAAVSFEHERATLIISYKKPLYLLAAENEDRKLRSSMKFSRLDDPKGGGAPPAECAQQ